MKSLYIFLYAALVLFSLFELGGCAYKGDVYLYSPSGSENSVEKQGELDSNVGLK
jgi:predicted small lipoprotein YifL